MSSARDMLNEFTRKMSAIKHSSVSVSEVNIIERAPAFDFVATRRVSNPPPPTFYSPIPEGRSVTEQCQCKSCGAWLHPNRPCRRCVDVKEST